MTDIHTRSTTASTAPNPATAAGPSVEAGGAILVALYLAAVIVPIGFDIGTLNMNALRLLLLFTVVPTAVGLYSGRYGKVYPADYLLLAHVVWVFVCIGVNNPDRVVEWAGAYSLELFGGYALGRAYIRSPEAFYRVIRTVLVFVALSLPFAIAESQSGTAVLIDLISQIPGLKSVQQIDIAKRLGLERAQVVFAHPIHYGLFCTTALSLTYVGMKGVMSGGARSLGVFAICVGVFLCLSSGALLAALMQFGLMAWNFIFRSNPRRWMLLVGLFAFCYVVVDLLSNRTPLRVFMSYATFSAHNAFWRAIIFEWGMMNVWDNPIFGLGLRGWIRPSFMRSGSIDNFWLVMAVKFGIPGFLMIAGGYLDALIRVGRRALRPGSAVANLRLAWIFTFIGLTFSLATVHIWTSIFSFVFFLLGAGLWMADASDAPEAAAAPAKEPRRARTIWSREASPAATRREAGGPTLARAKDAPKTAPKTAAPAKASSARYTRFADGPGPDPRRRDEKEGSG